MRTIYLFTLLLISLTQSAQNYKFYKPGQFPTNYNNAVLLLKKGDKNLFKLKHPEDYKSFKAVKLLGFDESGFSLDSIIHVISLSINPSLLILENTDLNSVSVSLQPLTNLRELVILGDCGFFENSFFSHLKNNFVAEIRIQKESPELITDSLHYLKYLERVFISNSGRFTMINKTEDLQYLSSGNLSKAKVSYCDNFYINERELRSDEPVAAKFITEKNPGFPQEYVCVKQPVPGVNINDTMYRLNSGIRTNFRYKSGSIINIDKNAFVTMEGNPYRGKVDLFYREFRNPVEIMLSGIPMTAVDGDSVRLFRSGGMYEMYAKTPHGEKLKTVTDTSIKIKFQVTDTVGDYNFYTLNQNGSWTSKSQNLSTGEANSDIKKTASRAVKEYMNFIQLRRVRRADTTAYKFRFDNLNYMYTYRKDNLKAGADSSRVIDLRTRRLFTNAKAKGVFRISYKGRTKDQKIIFTITPIKSDMGNLIPRHVRALINHDFIYNGELSTEAFRNKYVRKKKYWDVRVAIDGDGLNLKLKTTTAFTDLKAVAVYVLRDNTYEFSPRSNRALVRRVNISTIHEARLFDKRKRASASDYNDTYGRFAYNDISKQAFNYCKKYQTPDENKMSFKEWKDYITKNFGFYNKNNFILDSQVGEALVKSGLGINNIDAYIHNCEMEPFFVQYNQVDLDTLSEQYNAMLFKSINTIYPLVKDPTKVSTLSGYYFKNRPNYVIRFSENGYMQVTQPAELKAAKKGSDANLVYKNEYLVKGLSSKEITKLIFD